MLESGGCFSGGRHGGTRGLRQLPTSTDAAKVESGGCFSGGRHGMEESGGCFSFQPRPEPPSPEFVPQPVHTITTKLHPEPVHTRELGGIGAFRCGSEDGWRAGPELNHRRIFNVSRLNSKKKAERSFVSRCRVCFQNASCHLELRFASRTDGYTEICLWNGRFY